MNLEIYRKNRDAFWARENSFRALCAACYQPPSNCYCDEVRRFDPKMSFVILIHPIEMKRRIATGRMSHLILERSHLIMGKDYRQNSRVNALLADPRYYPVMLYPGPRSTNLTSLSIEQRADAFPKDRELLIFVIDGTWSKARQMVRLSENLTSLPRICFTPQAPSRFRVRKQPDPNCFSTIEAIHHTIELLGESQGLELADRRHDNLLAVFDKMVERQLAYLPTNPKNTRS